MGFIVKDLEGHFARIFVKKKNFRAEKSSLPVSFYNSLREKLTGNKGIT